MDEFSPGNCLDSEKHSNGFKKSSKKVQLRADIKFKIKQRLQRKRGEKKQDINNAGAGSTPELFTLPPSTNKCGTNIANAVEKLWKIERNQHLCKEKFVYAGRVPCFLPRNLNKVDKKKRVRATKRQRQCKKLDETYSLWMKRGRHKVKEPNSTKEFFFRLKHRNIKRVASGSIENNRVKRLRLGSEHDESEVMSGVRTRKCSAKVQSFEPVNVKRKARDRNDKKLHRNLQKQSTGKMDGIERTLACKNSDFSSVQVGRSRQNEKKLTEDVKVSLIDCFANGLHTKKNSSLGPFQTTSTPKANRTPTYSHEVSISHINPGIPTSDSRRIPTSYTTSKITRSYVTSTFSKSNPRVPPFNITPPESAESCTEDERTIFSEEKEFTRGRLRHYKTDVTSKRDAEKIVYKPLFSNKPRFCKSVVVEND